MSLCVHLGGSGGATGRAAFTLIGLAAAFALGCGGSRRGDATPSAPSMPSTSPCLIRAVFGNPAESLYVLPYPVGTAYRVMTSYCSSFTYPDHIGIDFDMPMGAEIVAARAGVVIEAIWHFEDEGSDTSRTNLVRIQHADGTVADYLHFQQNGVIVQVGDKVGTGQLIGRNGASGAPMPHLHFAVYRDAQFDRAQTLPINFRNAEGPLDSRGGLIAGTVYRALAYQTR